MVQTISRNLSHLLPPSLIITDENHHCLARSYRKIYDYFSGSYCLGFTATPVRLNGGGLGEVNDILITGPTVRELIARNCLADFDYYAPPVADLSGLRSRAGDYSAEDIEKALNKPQIYGDVVSYYRQLADGKQAVCYCAGITSSRAMAETFTQNGISAAHIDGDTPKAERAETIEKFRRGELKILCNVDLISEGFDVPDCAAAILLRPTKSLTLYIQQSMRCMRYKPGKRAVIIDHVGNVHRFGLPDQDFEWTLEPKPQGKKQEKSDEDFKIRQCPECFCTHTVVMTADGIRCPNCGYVYPARERTVEEKKEARLEKITETVRHYKKPSECRTREELRAYRKRGADRMTPEHIIQNHIRKALSPYAVIFRANVGKVRTPDGRFFDTGLPPGFPDLFGFRKSDGKMIFIEVKSPHGKLSKLQQWFLDNTRDFPVIYGVCRSADDALRLVNGVEDDR